MGRMSAGVVFLVGSAVSGSVQAQLNLSGADTLADVTNDAIIASGSAGISYRRGGSSAGEVAMISGPFANPTQQIAPMTRELGMYYVVDVNGDLVLQPICSPAIPQSQQLIGLDGIAIVGGNQTAGDSLAATVSPLDDCSDTIRGLPPLPGIFKSDGVTPCDATDGCSPDGTYTFIDWKDVLAMVYGGQNHNLSQPQLLVLHGRNPSRINCDSPVRRKLVDSWSMLFGDVTPAHSCRTGTCTKLRHAFRFDDRSGTTDVFLQLIGLVPVPPFTTTYDPSTLLPKPDVAATANPFCNAGDKLMNKGDSDYLDLDPIRRAADQTATTRVPLEQVGEAGLPAFGGNNSDANCAFPGAIPPTDSSASSVPNLLPRVPLDPANVARLQQELGFPGGGSAALNPFTRACLGLVLPISVPGNYTTADAYFGASADGTVPPLPCSIDPITGNPVMANKILDTVFTSSLCLDGKTQPCRVPVNNSTGTNNFNCYLDALNPTILPLRDNRGFHLHPVTNTGVYKRDNYFNPLIPDIAPNRQARVVTAFFRMNFSHATNLNGSVPTLPAGEFCRKLSSSNQIGCLVKANTCTVGMGHRGVIDPVGSAHNFAFRIDDLVPSVFNIQNSVRGGAPVYPMARKLWVTSVKGFPNVANGLFGGAEHDLMNFFQTPGLMDPIIVSRNFVQVPPEVLTRTYGCPSGLP